MRVVGCVTLVLVIGAAGGCASGGQFQRPGTPNVWVGSDQADPIMVQLVRTGNALSGTLDETALGSGATSAKPVHAAFSGTVDGDAMTLTFPQGLGFSTSLSGTLSDQQMSLRVTQDDGIVATVTLQPGSVDEYNRLVATLNGQASANASASQAAAEQAAVTAQQDQARRDVDTAAEAVNSDVSSLRTALNDKPDFGSFDKDLAAARTDLAAAKTDAAKAAADDGTDACSDADSAQSDEDSVQSDSDSIDSDMDSLGANVDVVDSALSAVDKDLDAYHAAEPDAPGYRSPDAPDEPSIRQIVGSAHATTAAWKKRGGTYRATVAKLVAQATAIANEAEKRYC